MASSLTEKVERYVQTHAMLQPGDRIVVAVSGGSDSCALLGVLDDLRDALQVDLIVAHLDHRLRGEASAADAAFVRELAERKQLACAIREEDVASYAKCRKISIEEAARETRYRFLASVAQEHSAAVVAVGHTLEDRVETFFLHLFRGAGPEGVTSMRPVRMLCKDIRIIRPLLACTHEDAKAFNLAQGVTPRADATNMDTTHPRNKIRLCLLPHLRAQYCSDIERKISRLMELWQDECECLETLEATAMDGLRRSVYANSPVTAASADVLRRDAFLALPRALQRRAVRRAFQRVHGDRRDLDFQHVENLLHWLQSGSARGEWTLPAGVSVCAEPTSFRFQRKTHVPRARHGEDRIALHVPGITKARAWNCMIEAKTFPRPPQLIFPREKAVAWTDGEKIGELWLRMARPGDRFQPLGCRGSQKLQDFFVNTKVPRAYRWQTPVVETGNEIVWVAGYRVDDRFKVTGETTLILELRLLPNSGCAPVLTDCPPKEVEGGEATG